jgi:hypothetical protein
VSLVSALEHDATWQVMSPFETLDEGAHIAVLYSDRMDRDSLLLPYLAAAARAGNSSVLVASDEPGAIKDHLDSEFPGSSEALEIYPTGSTYLRDGAFAGSEMADWLTSVAQQAPTGSLGKPSWIAGDIDWVEGLDDETFGALLAYEGTLDSFAHSCRHTFACFYNAEVFPPKFILDVFRTHAKVLVGGAMWHSPFYVAPTSLGAR